MWQVAILHLNARMMKNKKEYNVNPQTKTNIIPSLRAHKIHKKITNNTSPGEI